jgi:DNA invertase Pin-like site-specific DNA recombinase
VCVELHTKDTPPFLIQSIHNIWLYLGPAERSHSLTAVSKRRTLPARGDAAKLPDMVGAVVYVRVSTKEQTENLSLPTQLRACEEYCRRQGYEILERFHEEGESAKTTDRTQLQALLKYCRTHKGKVHFLVVYNLTRFAREKYDHFALRAHLSSLGISLRSVTEPIDDTSTGKLMEGVLAAFAQFDNDVRSERTLAGMKAALSLGRWTFQAPLGYLNAPKCSKSSLVQDPARGPLVKQAFEELATGRFTAQEVIRRATVAGLRTRRDRALSPQTFGDMLRNRIYIGQVESPDCGVSAHGDFEPLIDEATFYRAQAVLDGRVPVAAPRQRNHPDFPLRGFVRCESCGRPLTGSWSKGRNCRYARRTGPPAADARLHAARQGSRALCVGAGVRRGPRANRRPGTAAQGRPLETRPARRGVPVLGIDRPRNLQPPTRQAPRGTHAVEDRPSRRRGRRTRRRRHPGVCRTHSAACIGPMGASLARLQAAAPAAVLPRGDCVRRISIQSNRRNRSAFQVLGGR